MEVDDPRNNKEELIAQEVESLRQENPEVYEPKYFRGIKSSTLIGIKQAGGRLLTLGHLFTRPNILILQKTSGTIQLNNQDEVGFFVNYPQLYSFNFANSYAAPQYDWKKFRDQGTDEVKDVEERIFIEVTLRKILELSPEEQNLIFNNFQIVLGFGSNTFAIAKRSMDRGALEGECAIRRDVDLHTELTHIFVPFNKKREFLEYFRKILPQETLDKIRIISSEAYMKLDATKTKRTSPDSELRTRQTSMRREVMLPYELKPKIPVDKQILIDPKLISKIMQEFL
ncbi:MAG: hypothetical protein M1426_04560, partial [Patescibacteria group bacterium]|nr:hypothetical protein [Patescibacteria group bacterium]